MNNERNELASVIVEAYGEDAEVECPCEQDLEVADAILSAGYRKPQQVTTVEELDALPYGSVILDRSGLSLHKNEFTGWRASNGAKDITAEMLENEALPARVLHIGGNQQQAAQSQGNWGGQAAADPWGSPQSGPAF